jgi:transcriptional regulator with XRE-family HTH domain
MEQDDIAVALEISRGSISAYERGVTPPKGLVLRAWALATGVNEHWLRTGEITSGPSDGVGVTVRLDNVKDISTPSHPADDQTPEGVPLRLVA